MGLKGRGGRETRQSHQTLLSTLVLHPTPVFLIIAAVPVL